MIVDCAHYRDGRRQREGPMDLDVAAEVCKREDERSFVWIRLFEPDASELAEVQERFGLHDLAVEDAQGFHLRPKVEQYDEAMLTNAKRWSSARSRSSSPPGFWSPYAKGWPAT
jgi:magnesium transporter